MFGQFSSYVIFFLVGSVTAILLYLLFISWRNPVLAKLGLRSLTRRPTQTALIIIGLTLSTVIIISSLGTGDTLRYSVQRQSVAAYGKVDEIIAPPLISMLTNMGNPNASNEQAQQARATLEGVMRGGVDSVLALAQGGLPVDQRQPARTAAHGGGQGAADRRVAGAIVFPTIIRNATRGPANRSALSMPWTTSTRRPLACARSRASRWRWTRCSQASAMSSCSRHGCWRLCRRSRQNSTGWPPTCHQTSGQARPSAAARRCARWCAAEAGAPPLAAILAGLGAVITGVDPQSLPDISISLDTLDQLGVNTQPLRVLGSRASGCASWRQSYRQWRRPRPQAEGCRAAAWRAAPARRHRRRSRP